MADASEITITVKGPSELKLSITIDPSSTIADLKAAVAAKSDVEKERQRLIYSGKVLKDEETVASYKIATGHTIHMVKTQPPAAAAPAAAAAARLPTTMGTGLASGNMLDTVENHHGLAGFNPFPSMGVGNPNDPNAMLGLMDNPEFLRQMSDLMSRPEVVDQIIASNPQLQQMGPFVRQMMQSPMFREMLADPQRLRQMMQMQQAMGGMGGMGGMGAMPGMGGMFGGAGAGAAAQDGATAAPTDPFPNLFAPNAGTTGAAGATNTTPGAGAGATRAAGSPGAAGAAGAAAANPFAALFGAPGAGAGAAGTGGAGAGANPFPFMDPAMLFGGNPFLGGGLGSPAAQADTRPPEEIYATQLGQLSAMGLWDSAKNIRALRSTGGNVEAAIELLFSGQLDGPGGQ